MCLNIVMTEKARLFKARKKTSVFRPVASGSDTSSDGAVRVVFYNIRYGTGSGWHYHLPVPFSGFFRSSRAGTGRIAEYLGSLDADVMCLCEVDGGSYRHGNRCQASRMASEQGWHHVYANKYGKGSLVRRMPLLSSQGNAVLSRMPMITARERHLSRGVKRTYLEVEFDRFVVILAHLSLGRRARTVQLHELARHCRKLEKPLVLGGDFNLLQGSSELDPLLQGTGLRDADAEMGRPTFPSHRPGKRLDYVLASREISVRRIEVPRVPYSDHLPLVCDIRI